MKNIVSHVHMEQQTSPRVIETANKEWIEFGDAQYRNQYPQFLIELYQSSATHSAVVNATSDMIAGEELVIEEDGDLTNLVELKKFLADINGKGGTAHDLIKKTAFDLKLHGAYAWNIIYNVDRTKIIQVHHIPVEKVRSGKPNAMGIVDKFYVSSDWTQYRKKEYTPVCIDAFSTTDRTAPNQLYYTGLYTAGMDIYHAPDYVASTNWILTDNLTSNFHLANISNGFAPSYWINFNNGVPTDEERFAIESQIANKFSGANNAGKFVLTFSDDANAKPDLQAIQLSDADKQYTVLNELCIQNIMIGHRVTSPMLLGVKTDGQLGGRNEILEAFELYSNTVVRPFQDIVLKSLKMLLNFNGLTSNVSIKSLSPLNSMFDSDVLTDVLTQDEIRAELGYAPLEQVEEQEQRRFSEESVLDDFLANHGEDEDLDNWTLIDESDATDEHEEFDFEYNLEKLLFARVGKALPNRKSEQDGFDKNLNLYRVRYKYSGKTKADTGERTFCSKMMLADKVYRKEDIIGQVHSLSSIKANPKLSGNDTGIYNIWKFKGGANCHHRWYRRIYVTKFGDKPNVDTDAVITTTKARSQGFKPVANDQEVPVAPIDMPNRGYKTKQD